MDKMTIKLLTSHHSLIGILDLTRFDGGGIPYAHQVLKYFKHVLYWDVRSCDVEIT